MGLASCHLSDINNSDGGFWTFGEFVIRCRCFQPAPYSGVSMANVVIIGGEK